MYIWMGTSFIYLQNKFQDHTIPQSVVQNPSLFFSSGHSFCSLVCPLHVQEVNSGGEGKVLSALIDHPSFEFLENHLVLS